MTWTPRQIQILRDKFEKVSWTELKGLFPGLSKAVIYRKARSLGLNRSSLSTANGGYGINYALCHRHGRILMYEIQWKQGIPTCPRCGQRLRMKARTTKFKGDRIEI